MRLLRLATLAACLVMVVVSNAQEFDFVAPQVKIAAPGNTSFLGVGVAEINADRAKTLKLKEERGVEITRVEEDSPAAKAGLKTGDAVLEYNGQRVEGTEQFVRMVRETPPGRQARLVVSRDGSTQTMTATVGARKGGPIVIGQPFDSEKLRQQMDKLQQQIRVVPDVPSVVMSWRSGALGITAQSLESQLAEYFGVKEGVLVAAVSKDSAAEKAGFKAGDVILKVEENKVTAPREVTNAIRQLGSKTTFPVTVVRNHKEMVLTVSLPQRSKMAAPAAAPPAPPAPPARPVSTGPQL